MAILSGAWRKELETGEAVVVLQLSAKPHQDLAKVPLAMKLAKTEGARKLIQAVTQAHGAAVRLYVLPPGTPKDRVEILRKAFRDTVKDTELLNEAGKANLEVNPGSGEDLERNVRELLVLTLGGHAVKVELAGSTLLLARRKSTVARRIFKGMMSKDQESDRRFSLSLP
jgi:hypothetical protein